MAGRVAGKKALITGAAQGLGAAQAWMLAREGAQVLLADINAAGVAEQAAAINAELGAGTAFATALDVTQEDQWIEALEKAQAAADAARSAAEAAKHAADAAQSYVDDMLAASPMGLRMTKEGLNMAVDEPVSS